MRSTCSWPLVILVLMTLATGCGDNAGAAACERLEKSSCETDNACASADPCSMSCDAVGEPEDADALETCVDEYEAIALPAEASDPLGHAQACASRSAKMIDCLATF